jgi:two-component system, cell cycle sensor histidine kinase and response regulator CckA
VEDAASVLGYSLKIFKGPGYRVLKASNGEEALRIVRECGCEIHLLMTDVILPGMNGRQIADKLTAQNPRLKVLFCSGYTENAIVHHGVLDPQLHFIGKPFDMLSLSRKIRSILDAPK